MFDILKFAGGHLAASSLHQYLWLYVFNIGDFFQSFDACERVRDLTRTRLQPCSVRRVFDCLCDLETGLFNLLEAFFDRYTFFEADEDSAGRHRRCTARLRGVDGSDLGGQNWGLAVSRFSPEHLNQAPTLANRSDGIIGRWYARVLPVECVVAG
jgi:hypothetical protein